MRLKLGTLTPRLYSPVYWETVCNLVSRNLDISTLGNKAFIQEFAPEELKIGRKRSKPNIFYTSPETGLQGVFINLRTLSSINTPMGVFDTHRDPCGKTHQGLISAIQIQGDWRTTNHWIKYFNYKWWVTFLRKMQNDERLKSHGLKNTKTRHMTFWEK